MTWLGSKKPFKEWPEKHIAARHEQPPAYPDADAVNCTHSPRKGTARSAPWDQPCPAGTAVAPSVPENFAGAPMDEAAPGSGESSASCRRRWEDVVSAVRHLRLSHHPRAPSVNEPTGSSPSYLLSAEVCLPHRSRCLILGPDIRPFGVNAASTWSSTTLWSGSGGQRATW